MFLIQAKNSLDWAHALFFLSSYNVRIKMVSDAETLGSMYMIVSEDEMHGQDESHEAMLNDLGLAEWAFMGNFTQKKQNLCIECRKEIEKTGEGSATCGHVTFESLIVGGLR